MSHCPTCGKLAMGAVNGGNMGVVMGRGPHFCSRVCYRSAIKKEVNKLADKKAKEITKSARAAESGRRKQTRSNPSNHRTVGKAQAERNVEGKASPSWKVALLVGLATLFLTKPISSAYFADFNNAFSGSAALGGLAFLVVALYAVRPDWSKLLLLLTVAWIPSAFAIKEFIELFATSATAEVYGVVCALLTTTTAIALLLILRYKRTAVAQPAHNVVDQVAPTPTLNPPNHRSSYVRKAGPNKGAVRGYRGSSVK